MEQIIAWIDEAILQHDIDAKREKNDDALIIQSVGYKLYVNGNPRSWWMGLKSPYKTVVVGTKNLAECIPQRTGRCWFIPETETIPLPVYDIDINDVQNLINHIPFIEYYLVSKDYLWLMVESDHNTIFVCVSS